MAELIEPFERELRRSRKTTPQIQSWFEDDMARALAEMEARTGTARTYGELQPGDAEAGIIAREAPRQTQAATVGEMIANPVREPENLDAVRRELIDPLVQAYGMESRGLPARSVRPPAPPRITKAGSDTWMEDPLTREWKQVVTGPKSAQAARLTESQRSQMRLAEDEVTSARRAWEKIPADKENLDAKIAAKDRELAAEKRLRKMFPVAAPAAEEIVAPPVSDLEVRDPFAPTSFMGAKDAQGNPEGPNMVKDDFVAVVNPSGKATKIKASDLQRALKSGYKRR